MTEQDYEYKGLIAESWDLLRGDTADWPDRVFYRDIIRENGQPALDIGCGTGRLLLDYMSDGLDVDGVDESPEMLAICREKAAQKNLDPNLFAQTMETLSLPRSYRTIIVPSSSFQLVTDLDRAHQALVRFFRHLQPGGILVMSIMNISGDVSEDWALVGEKTRPEDGLVVRRWWRGTFNPKTQLQDTEDRYELVKDGQVLVSEDHRRAPATRNYSQEQIVTMMGKAGFSKIRTTDGFSHDPAQKETELFCIFGSRS